MFASLLALAAPPASGADEIEVRTDDGAHGFGLGVVVGEPTGLSLALRPNDHNAVQAHVSWSVVRGAARMSVDYLQTVVIVGTDGPVSLPVYVGVGPTIGFDGPPPWQDAPFLGARIPIGITMIPERVPVELFGELAPVLYVVPETAGGLEGVLGARFYF